MSAFVVLDIDHTLLSDAGELLAKNKEAVARAKLEGATVILATARSYAGAKPIHDALNLSTPLIVSNGTLVYAPEGTLMMAETLSPDTARQVVDKFKASEHHWSIRTQERAYLHPLFEADRPPFNNTLHYHKIHPERLPEVLGDYASIVTASLFGQNLKPFYDAGGWHDLDLRADYYLPSHYSRFEAMSVISMRSSKGEAVRWLRHHMGMDKVFTLTMGDSPADATMFPLGIGVAPANASPEALEAADWIAPHCDKASVAAALEKYVLGTKGQFMSTAQTAIG